MPVDYLLTLSIKNLLYYLIYKERFYKNWNTHVYWNATGSPPSVSSLLKHSMMCNSVHYIAMVFNADSIRCYRRKISQTRMKKASVYCCLLVLLCSWTIVGEFKRLTLLFCCLSSWFLSVVTFSHSDMCLLSISLTLSLYIYMQNLHGGVKFLLILYFLRRVLFTLSGSVQQWSLKNTTDIGCCTRGWGHSWVLLLKVKIFYHY